MREEIMIRRGPNLSQKEDSLTGTGEILDCLDESFGICTVIVVFLVSKGRSIQSLQGYGDAEWKKLHCIGPLTRPTGKFENILALRRPWRRIFGREDNTTQFTHM
jgi:hypothetical protein